ncbi:S1 RNA-binding domain-containing protein 1 [Biomphalaria pfeifferi]|uniref:S1 RNA-binding domain-containing protein 1 n=1 Tax=Biomphalaria pfeifferi TaxID=112525 RepID=A0AAD8BTM7_BIOPF|nr:S1 RNA-binding domain-containing protein 1 [Biomphalaria pfeifferi]
MSEMEEKCFKEEKDIKKEIVPAWEPAEILSSKLKLRRQSVFNVIKLLDDGATIPFIARYRKEQTDNMEPDLLREVATGLEELRTVESKIQSVYKSIEKMGKMNEELETSLICSTSILDIESIYAPFKPGHKGTYAERARALGLEEMSQDVLNGRHFDVRQALDPCQKGLENEKAIEKGLMHIIADIVSKNKDLMDEARNICERCTIMLESSKAKEKTNQEKVTKDKKKKEAALLSPRKLKAKADENVHKFTQFFEYKMPSQNLKPHQILAINRGEDLKLLTVKISIPESAKKMFVNFALSKLLRNVYKLENQNLITKAVDDAYDRLIEPMLSRTIRAELTKCAEKASIAVFVANLKRLLLAPPVKSKTILGIDPGFTNGCKVAVISSTGVILETAVIYLHDTRSNKHVERNRVASLVRSHRVDIITIGNGVACRETEQVIADMIKNRYFQPLSIVYCIVDECGASIYSISEEAAKEMPDLDPTLRGAVSIARRLQDPLAELVKIEPKHLGVGMYQHDVNKTKLQAALKSVVEECVSFVGVDLNTCSECLLRSVAGLNVAKAKKIIEWRTLNGHFINRNQLLSIKGLGAKGFEQCAGFVRICRLKDSESQSDVKDEVKEEIIAIQEEEPKKGRKRKAENSSGKGKAKKKKADDNTWNPLDATSIHPESYEIAQMLASYLNVDLAHIGTPDFISKVKERALDKNLHAFCLEKSTGLATVMLIADALKQPLAYDMRESFQKPLFKQEIQSINDLRLGSQLTGRVTNVTHFGAFVDIGVGMNGLIHTSKMGSNRAIGVGDHVEVKVQNLDVANGRISLFLSKVL